jgi:hypothetical protein
MPTALDLHSCRGNELSYERFAPGHLRNYAPLLFTWPAAPRNLNEDVGALADSDNHFERRIDEMPARN